MKKIGLVGGISWTSTVDYYRFINEETNKKLGGLNFAECILYSVNFNDFQKFNADSNWDGSFKLLSAAALNLQKAGAELVILCANTAHIVAERISDTIDIPLVDIRIATAEAIHAIKLKKVALVGTSYTMEMDFYRNKLSEQGIETLVPDSADDRNYIEETLLHELGKGIIRDETRQAYLKIIDKLLDKGAEGVILGCTEIPLLISESDLSVPVFNTTLIHARAAVDFALT